MIAVIAVITLIAVNPPVIAIMIACMIALIAPFARIPLSGNVWVLFVDWCRVCHPFRMPMLSRGVVDTLTYATVT